MSLHCDTRVKERYMNESRSNSNESDLEYRMAKKDLKKN